MNLDRFNDRQKEAIVTTDGPLLILAGAGSGKTTVVVNKIAYILELIQNFLHFFLQESNLKVQRYLLSFL